MFIVDPNITDLTVREKGIYKVLFSMNIHPVATPDLGVEDARCYIIFFHEGSNLSAYIGIYFTRTDRMSYYSYSSNPFPFEAVADVEDDARGFAEDMGFVLDEINIAGMSLHEKNRWIDEQAIFGHKQQPEAQPRPAPPAEPPREPAAQPVPAAQEPKLPPQPQKRPAPQVDPGWPESIVQRAVSAGAAKPPKEQLKKEAQSTNGVVSRDKQALAHLVASF